MKKNKPSKTMYNEIFKDFVIESSQIKKLQEMSLSILIDIDKICRDNSLTYILGGGTMLGAVRHNGFIPWDDDIDINMPREDIAKLVKFIENDYSENYSILSPNSSKDDPIKFYKIMKRETREVEIEFEKLPKKRSVGIDIFPIENCSNCAILRTIKGKLYGAISKISSVVYDYKYPSSIIIDAGKDNEIVREYYRRRLRIGKFFSFLPISFWVKFSECLAKGYNMNSKYVTIPTGMKSYLGEMALRSKMLDIVEYRFEGHMFFGVKDYDEYLTRLYKNYMQIPPEEKREKHILLELMLEDANNE